MAAPSTASIRGIVMSLNQLCASHWISRVELTAFGVWVQACNPSAFSKWRGGIFFAGFIPLDDTLNLVGLKPGDANVVIGYGVDKVTHTWSVGHLVAQSHIHLTFIGLTHFPLEQECEDYTSLDHTVAGFECGLDSILTDATETPKLDASFDKPDIMTFWVSFRFLSAVSFISDNHKPQLAPNIISQKLFCQARALHFPGPLAGKMSSSVLIHYFSGI